MSRWVKKGDNVVVIAGNDIGKKGNVVSRSFDRVIVQGVNIRKKHLKRRSQEQGPAIIEVEKSVHISNVALCDEDASPIHIKVRHVGKGKELWYEKDGKEIFFRTLRK